jgi:tetratricopeptide (TPR) repeat protein
MRSLIIVWICLVIAVQALSPAIGSESGDERRYLLLETTYRSLNAIHELINKGQYEKSLSRLRSLLSDVRRRDYDHAVVRQTIGYVYHTMGDYSKAIDSFVAALESHALPEEVTHRLIYDTARLLIAIERYRDGLHYLNLWLEKEPEPSADGYFLAATAHYKTGQCRSAINHANKAIALSSKPETVWYELLMSCYYELSRYRQAADVLRVLVGRHPDNVGYWRQLAGIYQHLKQDRNAIAVLELARQQGMLNEADLLRLARLYVHKGMPYRAVTLLERAIATGEVNSSGESLTLLADSLLMAQEYERAVTALKRAAKATQDGLLYYRLGQTLYKLGQWEETVTALQHALATEGFKQNGQANLLLGVAAYRNGDPKRAQKALQKALNDENTQVAAHGWLDRLRSNEVEIDY